MRGGQAQLEDQRAEPIAARVAVSCTAMPCATSALGNRCMVGRAEPAALARSTSLMPASASRANNFHLNGG